jgi:hypothetical protein
MCFSIFRKRKSRDDDDDDDIPISELNNNVSFESKEEREGKEEMAKRPRHVVSGESLQNTVALNNNASHIAASSNSAAPSSSSSSSSSLPNNEENMVGCSSVGIIIDEEPIEDKIADVRLNYRRTIYTANLMRSMTEGNGDNLRVRIKNYVNSMKEDSKRSASQSLIDINYTDENGEHLLMRVIRLFGDMCAAMRTTDPSLTLDLLDKEGVNEYLMLKMKDLNVRHKNKSGEDSLIFLVNRIVINAQIYTDWFVVNRLIELGKI